MEQRTCNIIMCCKGYGKGETIPEKIANYMSEECACPVEAYNENRIHNILVDAFIDYIGTCDNPRFEVCQYFKDTYGVNRTEDERIMGLFSFTTVHDYPDRPYINGFTEELLEVSDRLFGIKEAQEKVKKENEEWVASLKAKKKEQTV